MDDKMGEQQLWCSYCKEEIEGEFVVDNDETFHRDCYKIMRRNNDMYGDEIDWWVTDKDVETIDNDN